ncbi:MAG: hypothetical protein ABSD31_09200 [Candidatus Binataceae bacterium]|jgi:hypothetical protein
MNFVMKQGPKPSEGPVDDGNPIGDLPIPEPVSDTAAYLHERELWNTGTSDLGDANEFQRDAEQPRLVEFRRAHLERVVGIL